MPPKRAPRPSEVPGPDAPIKRRARSDWIQTDVGWRRLRSFNEATGRWKPTTLGKRWYLEHQPPSEFIIKVPAKFYTTKADGSIMEHYGWYPFDNFSMQWREEIERVLESGVSIPDLQLRLLERLAKGKNPAGEWILIFISDQLVVVDMSRDWQYSELKTEVTSMRDWTV